MTNSPATSVDARDPQVSVVIPAHNAEAYIAAALSSVFEQTFSNFEVILVNDGSPDSEALDQALQPYLPRIRYLRQENRGPSSARNLAVHEARGKYVAFLDSDDLWLGHHLARQMEILRVNPELGLVYANAVYIRPDKSGQDQAVGVAFETVPQLGEPTLDALLAERCTINTSSVVVLRDALLQAGLFDESMNRCEDFDLWLRLACAGVRMTYDREVQVCHRLGEGLAANNIRMKEGRVRAYQKMAANPGRTEAQQNIIRKKLNDLQLEIQTELVKRSLLAGQFEDALTAATKANSLVHGGKLRLAMIGLRYFPSLLREGYSIYLRVLQSYKRTKKTHLMKDWSSTAKL